MVQKFYSRAFDARGRFRSTVAGRGHGSSLQATPSLVEGLHTEAEKWSRFNLARGSRRYSMQSCEELRRVQALPLCPCRLLSLSLTH